LSAEAFRVGGYQSLQYQRGEAFLVEPDKARLTADY
jgi:hypothetical protein